MKPLQRRVRRSWGYGNPYGNAEQVCIGEHKACADGTIIEQYLNTLILKLLVNTVGSFGNLLIVAP